MAYVASRGLALSWRCPSKGQTAWETLGKKYSEVAVSLWTS